MPELGQLPLSEEASAHGEGTGTWACKFPVGIPTIPDPFGAPPGIEVISTAISQTVAPPTASSQDGASQNVEAMVQDWLSPP